MEKFLYLIKLFVFRDIFPRIHVSQNTLPGRVELGQSRQRFWKRLSLRFFRCSLIIAFGMGNHEFSVKKYYGFDITRMLAEFFRTNYYEDLALIKITLKNHTHRVLVTHGSTGSTTLGGAINWLLRIAGQMEVTPDICAMGHVHRLDIVLNPKWGDKFKTITKYIALTGNFFDTYSSKTSNYGTRKVFSPLPVGCVMFELFSDGKIQDHKIIEV